VAEYNRLTFAPVFEIDLCAVFGGDGIHGEPFQKFRVVFVVLVILGQGVPRSAIDFALGAKPMILISPMRAALVEPDVIRTPGDFGVQVQRFRRSGWSVCLLSRFSFHGSVLSMVLITLITGRVLRFGIIHGYLFMC